MLLSSWISASKCKSRFFQVRDHWLSELQSKAQRSILCKQSLQTPMFAHSEGEFCVVRKVQEVAKKWKREKGN